MTDTTRVAIAAHLHVLLRRKTGRVTDTEWLAVNDDYAAAIVRYAREQALERGAPELADWAGKLEQAARKAVHAAPAVPVLRDGVADSLLPGAEPEPPGPDIPRYVGGIR